MLKPNVISHWFLIFFCLQPIHAFCASESEVTNLCARLLEEVGSSWSFVENIYSEGNRRYPDDPVQRALWIRQNLPTQYQSRAIPFRLVPSRRINVDRRRGSVSVETSDRMVAHTAGNDHPSIRVIADYELNSLRYVSVNDSRVRQENFLSEGEMPLHLREIEFQPHQTSRIIASWSGGLTGLGSNSGRVMNQLRIMSGVRTDGTIAETLRGGETPYWVESAVSAIDVPFHGGATADLRYMELTNSLNFRRRYFESLASHHLPILAGCRSGESFLLGQLAFENPNLIQGMVWLGGMHPVEGYGESLQAFLDTGVRRGAPYNPLALRWFLGTRDQLLRLPRENRWWEQETPFQIPLLIIVGDQDPQVAPETRSAFRSMARRNPGRIFYVEVPGGGHDPFAVTESFRGEPQRWTQDAEIRAGRAWTYVYWFTRSHVLRDQSVPEPPFGWLLH